MADDLPGGAWWIDEPTLAGGPNPTDAHLKSLKDQGFTAIICLLAPQDRGQVPKCSVEDAKAAGFVWRRMPVRDFTAPTLAQMEEFMRVVESFQREGRRGLVHCQGGADGDDGGRLLDCAGEHGGRSHQEDPRGSPRGHRNL